MRIGCWSKHLWSALALGSLALPGAAQAEAEDAPLPIPVQVPAPYSAPFGLRSVMPGNVVRLDSSLATSSVTTGSSTALVQFLSGSYKVADHLAVNARLGWIDLASSPTLTGSALTDLSLG